MSKNEYNTEALKKNIEAAKKNIEIFEAAIEQEQNTIRQYREYIRIIEEKREIQKGATIDAQKENKANKQILNN